MPGTKSGVECKLKVCPLPMLKVRTSCGTNIHVETFNGQLNPRIPTLIYAEVTSINI